MSIDVQEESKYIDMHFNVVREIDSLKRILEIYYSYKLAYDKGIDISAITPFLDDWIGDDYAFLAEMMERRNNGQTFYITDKLKIKLSKVLDEIALIDLTILEKMPLLRECLEKIKETYFYKDSSEHSVFIK